MGQLRDVTGAVQAMDSGQNIVLDFSSAHLMSDLELKSMCQQIAHSYSYNVRATVPCSLHLCSFEASCTRWVLTHMNPFVMWSTIKREYTRLQQK